MEGAVGEAVRGAVEAAPSTDAAGPFLGVFDFEDSAIRPRRPGT